MNAKDTERICRICLKYFCCSNCRSKHETNYHKIFEDCELCVYGRTVLRKPSEKLLQHVKTQHLPIHCLFCKTVFLNIEDLLLCHTCSGQKNESKDIFNENYESPPTSLFYKSILISGNKFIASSHNVDYLTSTPMQRYDNGEFKKIPETPVDYPNNISDKGSIQSNQCNETPIFYDQSSANEAKTKRQVILSRKQQSNTTSPKNVTETYNELITQNYDTAWESALTDQKSTKSIHVIDNAVASLPARNSTTSVMENSSISDELYLTSEFNNEDNIPTSKKIKPVLREQRDSTSQLPIEEVAEESLVFIDENVYPNMCDTSTKQTSVSFKTDKPNESVWMTMTNAWKNAWKGLSHNYKDHTEEKLQEKAVKRPQPDDDFEDTPDVKRIKITDVQCRKTIHVVPILRLVNRTKIVMCYDKAVQTD